MTAREFPRVVTIDANVLTTCIGKSTSAENRRRLAHFFERVEKAKAKLIIPTPALAEYLVYADKAALDSIELLERKSYILIAPFDRAAAYECSQMDAAALGRGDKRDGRKDAWRKVKIDRQIVAIGKANGTQAFLSDDFGVETAAKRIGVPTMNVRNLELPTTQGELKLRG